MNYRAAATGLYAAATDEWKRHWNYEDVFAYAAGQRDAEQAGYTS